MPKAVLCLQKWIKSMTKDIKKQKMQQALKSEQELMGIENPLECVNGVVVCTWCGGVVCKWCVNGVCGGSGVVVWCGFLLANNRLAKPEKAIIWLLGSENQVPREVQCIHPAITCCLFRFRRGDCN